MDRRKRKTVRRSIVGRMFYGESMFSFQTNASKVALVYLATHLHHWGLPLLDCQLPSSHLESLGAETISRNNYINTMTPLAYQKLQNFNWELNEEIDIVNWKA